MTQLFDGRTTDGQSDVQTWHGGPGFFSVSGTFNGCTVKLQHSPDGGVTWFDALSVTAKDTWKVDLPPGPYRADLSDDGASTDIDAWFG